MSGRETDTHKFTRTYQVFIPLHKIVSVLVSTHFSIASSTGYTQIVPLFKLESPKRYFVNLFLEFMKSLLYSFVNLGTMEFGCPPKNWK